MPLRHGPLGARIRLMRGAGLGLILVTLVACGGRGSQASPTATPAPSAATVPPPSTTPPASVAPQGSLTPVFGHGRITIETKGGPVVLTVEIAESDAQHEYGLMNRRSMPPDSGMLFVFQPPADAKRIGFWMKDTLIPLSIAFVEPGLTIESLQEMQALDESIHYAPADYAYAVEANQGYFTSHNVAVGDKVSIQR